MSSRYTIESITLDRLKQKKIPIIDRDLSDPPGIRTRNLLLRRQLLYPVELADHFVVSPTGLYALKQNLFATAY